MTQKKTSVYFIGAGPGDPGLLTLKACEVIKRADVVFYAGSLVSPDIIAFAGKKAHLVDSAPLNLEEILDIMLSAVRRRQTVARIHSGDPSLYGAIAEQMHALKRHKVPFEIIPGVSSAFAAAAALKIEYTLPETTQTLILTRMTGRTPVPERESLRSLAAHRTSMAIFLSVDMIHDVVRELVNGGYPEETPAAVVYKASWPDQQQITGTLATIGERVRRRKISRQALILVGDALRGKQQALSKLYSPNFTHGYRQTKKEKKKGTAIVAVTRRGWLTGRRILQAFDDGVLFLPEKYAADTKSKKITYYRELKTVLNDLVNTYSSLILVMATGIAVRMIAPLLKSKWEDPAIVAMDESGRNIISLVSGHWGGANDLTEKLAIILGGNPVVTTESDVMGFPSVDLLVKAVTGGTLPEDTGKIKKIQSAILDGEDIGFCPKELRSFPRMDGHPNLHFFDSASELIDSHCKTGVIVSPYNEKIMHDAARYLHVIPRSIIIGMGCHRGISDRKIEQELMAVLKKQGLPWQSIAAICTIDRKQSEKGLVAFSRRHTIPLQFFSSRQISRVRGPSPDSRHALKVMGVHGVAEPCALLGATGGKLIMKKVKRADMTIAIAQKSLQQVFEERGIDYD